MLIERHQNLVFGMIMRQVGDRVLAEELAHECFVRAYKHLAKVRAEANFSTWLTRIALNVTSSYFTSRRYREALRSESFDVRLHDRGQDSDPSPAAETMLNSFRQALANLKPKFREVLTLCALEGKSYEDAAQVLAIPVGTVRSRLNKARLLLKAELQYES